MKETWPESFSEIGLRLEWWRESTGKIMTVVLAHESHAPLAPVSFFFLFSVCLKGGGAWRSTAEQKMMAHCLTSHFVFHLSWITELRIWFGVGIFFPSTVECSSFQVLVSQEVITYPLQIGRTTELLLCWMAAMLGSSRCWILSIYIFLSFWCTSFWFIRTGWESGDWFPSMEDESISFPSDRAPCRPP